MNKLVIITLRWMRRDKKRTLLSFLSIAMAMYLLMFVGVYFSSCISILRSELKYEDGSAHADITVDNVDTAEKVVRNASVSDGAYALNYDNGLFYESFLRKYTEQSDAGSHIPQVYLNGTTLDEVGDKIYGVSLVSGDLAVLHQPQNTKIIGRTPERDGEIMLDSGTADLFGAQLDKPFTVRYEVRGCELEYAVQEVPQTMSYENGDVEYTPDYDKAVWKNADENGEPVFEKDTDGSIMKKILSQFIYSTEDGTFYNLSTVDLNFNQLLKEMLSGSYICREIVHDKLMREYTVRAVLSDKITEYEEKTFTVVGLIDPRAEALDGGLCELCCYGGDEWAQRIVSETQCWGGASYVRIKSGLDIDTELRQICKSAGFEPTEVTPDGFVIERVNSNEDLIFLEGRGYENAGNTLLLFGAMIVVVFVFVFFARLIINNAFELSSAYRMEQYGALKTIGASNRQVFAMVFTECMIYMLLALPIAIGLALLTGRLIMNGIMSLNIFDLQFGSGVSEKFFSLEVIPVIFVTAVFVAIFSVIFSGYACAIRIKKLTPIAAAVREKKQKAPRRREWLSRKLFGFPTGYAVKSAGRNKMRGAITLLAAFVSGTIVVTISTLLYAIDKNQLFEPIGGSDYEVVVSEITGELDPAAEYRRLKDSGLFTRIEAGLSSSLMFYESGTSDIPESIKPALNDEFISYYETNRGYLDSIAVQLFAVTPEQFEELETDIDYEAFAASDGIILSNVSRSGIPKAFKDGLTEITLPVIGAMNGKPINAEFTFPVAGYIKSDNSTYSSFSNSEQCLSAIVSVDKFSELKKTNDEALYPNGRGSATTEYFGFELYIGSTDEDAANASIFLRDGNYEIVTDNVSRVETSKRISEALKIAGFSLAGVIFAVALINIVATSAANIVNRRRELSMLRACGMSMRQITASLTVESLFCALLTAAISSAAGTFLAVFLFKLLDSNEMPTLPWFAPLLIGLLVFGVMLGSYLLPLHSIKRSPIAKEIRSKE